MNSADELRACIAAGSHNNLIDTIGQVLDHHELKQVLVLQLIPADYHILGAPPSFDTCSRDCFPADTNFEKAFIFNTLLCIASAANHLHSSGISHGDLYAHNILVTNSGKALLGDFGAATIYQPGHSKSSEIQRLEVLAFGHLVEDLITHAEASFKSSEEMNSLRVLHDQCVLAGVNQRPTFTNILTQLQMITRIDQTSLA